MYLWNLDQIIKKINLENDCNENIFNFYYFINLIVENANIILCRQTVIVNEDFFLYVLGKFTLYTMYTENNVNRLW